MRKTFLSTIAILLIALTGFCQANGKLQMHFIKVGQGDAALLISPNGETVLFDNGVANHCEYPIDYLDSIGIKSIDYFICSHYHDDHFGCTTELFSRFPLKKKAFDRGSYVSTKVFSEYIKTIGLLRTTATVGSKLTLDAESDNPVVIEFIAMNGAGVKTDNENDLSLVTLLRFGELDILMGGDLSGINSGNYKDIESVIANNLGQVEVYKVHHHGSKYSSNSTFINVIHPKIGIVSASAEIGKNFNHPTQICMDRLHAVGIETYWTETGTGAIPDAKWDKVVGSIKIEAEPGDDFFKVYYGKKGTDVYKYW
jgi:beta-lactamase superfamily II metal-dependent hydrolase